MPRSEAALSRLRRKLALRTRFQAALNPELWVAARKELSKTPSAAAPEPDRESVRLLTASPLFDATWYTKVSGEDHRKDAAVRHYLTLGRAAGLSPHPLFDPDYFGGQHAASIGTRDPLVLYLAKRSSRSASPHPLFDLEAYVERVPAAMRLPLGPLGHYMDIGAADGVPPNDWYVPDPQREPGGLISWIEARATDWVNRRRAPAIPEPDAPVEAAAAAGSPRVSIVLVVGDDMSLVPAMVDSVRRQTIRTGSSSLSMLMMTSTGRRRLAAFTETHGSGSPNATATACRRSLLALRKLRATLWRGSRPAIDGTNAVSSASSPHSPSSVSIPSTTRSSSNRTRTTPRPA